MAVSNNLAFTKLDTTTEYFNNYFKPQFDVSQNIDEAITGYFERVTDNKESARTLAGAVIYTAKSQNLDPMAIIKEFAAMPKNQLNDYLTMFLNLNRVGTSYLGASNAPLINKYVSRMILP